MPILIGDLVQYDNRRWRVKGYDRQVRVCQLASWDGEFIEVADNAKGFEVVARPQAQWPFTTAPHKRLGGAITKVTRDGRELEPLVEWVPSSFGRSGGSIFFNPALRLRQGDVLVAHYEDDSLGRINITRGFGTIKHRRARAKKPATPQTVGERIRSGDDFFREGFDD